MSNARLDRRLQLQTRQQMHILSGPIGSDTAQSTSPRSFSGPITGAELGELLKRFKRLQNGSDIRGIALDGQIMTTG